MTRAKKPAAAGKKKRAAAGTRKRTASAGGSARLGMDPLAWLEEDAGPATKPSPSAGAPADGIAEAHEPAATAGPAPAADDVEGAPLALRLPGRFLVAQVDDAYRQLRQAFAEARAVRVDVSALETIDGAALQLLVAARRAAAAQGLDWTWQGQSTAFSSAVRLSGLQHELDTA